MTPGPVYVTMNCLDCGEVSLWSYMTKVGHLYGSDRYWYRFVCPECKTEQFNPCEKRIYDLLAKHESPAEVLVPPAEVLEERMGGDITTDDQLTFHNDIAADRTIERVLETARDHEMVTQQRWRWSDGRKYRHVRS